MSNQSTQMGGMTPYITTIDADKAIQFYEKVFGAKEVFRLTFPDSGKVCHAELILNGNHIMLGEEYPGMTKSPATLGGTPVRICLMVDDVDALIERAVKAGATVTCAAEDCFYGHRSGTIRDPFGHEWMLNHDNEKIDHAEMQSRWKKMTEKK